jgi:hypothetical protein
MTDTAQRLREKANDLCKTDGEAMQLWDKIRHTVETRKGSDLPRLMFEGFLEDIADLLQEGAEALDEAIPAPAPDPLERS